MYRLGEACSTPPAVGCSLPACPLRGKSCSAPWSLRPDLQVGSFARLGRIELSQGTLLDASSGGGGTALLRGGRLLMDRSSVFADNTGPLDGSGLGDGSRGGNVTVTATDSIFIAERDRDSRLRRWGFNLLCYGRPAAGR
jgi:hypothetical protein